MNRIVCRGEIHEINKDYIQGALSFRKRQAVTNPHPEGSQKALSWAYGRVNEMTREHVRFGMDVIIAADFFSITFHEDPIVPRDDKGFVLAEWYGPALLEAKKGQPVGEFLRQYGFTIEEVKGIRSTNYTLKLPDAPNYSLPIFQSKKDLTIFVRDNSIRLRRDTEAAIAKAQGREISIIEDAESEEAIVEQPEDTEMEIA